MLWLCSMPATSSFQLSTGAKSRTKFILDKLNIKVYLSQKIFFLKMILFTKEKNLHILLWVLRVCNIDASPDFQCQRGLLTF